MTVTDEDAKMFLDELTGSEHEHDRTTEFEEHTAQAREPSRKDCGVEDLHHNSPGKQTASQERDSNERDPRGDMTEPNGEATPSQDPIMSQDRRPEAQNEGEDLAGLKPEAKPCRTQAAWVTEAVAAVQANKKNVLNKGTVLIILDPTDSIKSCLLDANTLCKTSEVLRKLCEDAKAKSAGCVSQQALSAVLVLSSGSASIPELVAEALDANIESVLPAQPDDHPPADTGRTRLTRKAIAKIKAERDQENSPPAAGDEPEMPKTDWPKAYESFFRIIAGKKHGISNHDLSTALPRVHGVVQIAQQYSAIGAVKSTFISLLVDYVENRTLYSTIGKWPAHCLNLGVALESRLVYDEAFKHLVGSGANFKAGRVPPGLHDDVQAIVQRRSHELYSLRRDVEEKLILMTIPGNNPPEYPSQYVSQHDDRMAYNTVSIFRDWVMWHIGHLRNESQAEPEAFYLCDHDDGCTHVAGFYRTVADGDYLDANEVYDNFNSHYKSSRKERQEEELEIVRQTLETLKDEAHTHVKKFSESTLHLADKYGLRYLTCVEVEAEDVPWGIGSEGDSEEDNSEADED